VPWTLVRTTMLFLKDDPFPPVDASQRRIRFKSRTRDDASPNRIVPPARGGEADPTLHGALLVVHGVGRTNQRVQEELPSTGWHVLGTAQNPRGYAYRAAKRDPITRVVIAPDRLVVRGGGAGWRYQLRAPAQGRVSVQLLLGATQRLCAAAPPRLTGRPPSTAASDRAGRYDGAPTAPPSVCPTFAGP
jgi:hypothetical protein